MSNNKSNMEKGDRVLKFKHSFNCPNSGLGSTGTIVDVDPTTGNYLVKFDSLVLAPGLKCDNNTLIVKPQDLQLITKNSK